MKAHRSGQGLGSGDLDQPAGKKRPLPRQTYSRRAPPSRPPHVPCSRISAAKAVQTLPQNLKKKYLRRYGRLSTALPGFGRSTRATSRATHGHVGVQARGRTADPQDGSRTWESATTNGGITQRPVTDARRANFAHRNFGSGHPETFAAGSSGKEGKGKVLIRAGWGKTRFKGKLVGRPALIKQLPEQAAVRSRDGDPRPRPRPES